jgi:crotonobetainyl-CoA:carnitine CoA-transferase CaiB-like acyl-CoA transferase
MANIWSQYLNGNHSHKRMGNNHPSIVPYGVYKGKNNSYIVIGAGTAK